MIFIRLKDLFFKQLPTFFFITCIILSLLLSLWDNEISGFEGSEYLKFFEIKLYLGAVVVSFFVISIFVTILYFIGAKIIKAVNAAAMGNNNPDSKTNIYEIDNIIEKITSIAKQSGNPVYNVDLLSDYTGVMMGIFELDYVNDTVIMSSKLSDYLMIDYESKFENVIKMSIKQYKNAEKKYKHHKVPNEPNVYYVETSIGKRYLNTFYNQVNKKVIGYVIDITDYMQKKSLMFDESKFKNMTSFCSKAVFLQEVKNMIAENKNCIGVLFSMELEYLKEINDTYGYIIGDRYIKKMVNVLVSSSLKHIVCKKSESEILTFIYGFDDFDSTKNIISKWDENLDKAKFIVPDARDYRMKATVGYCYYPYDADNIDKMMKYSTFAFGEAKRFYQGTLHKFYLEDYNKDLFIQKKVDAFYELIEKNLVKYYFQPIVNIKNGEVFGYEALMRPQSEFFTSPREVLDVAASENRLYLIEKMTVLNCMEIVKNNYDTFLDKKLFYNTITEQILNSDDMKYIRDNYSDVAHLLMPEIVETRGMDLNVIIRKYNAMIKNETKITIDGFGLNYIDERFLESVKPNYIKISKTIVNDINLKNDNQALLTKILKYAKKNHIFTIAVGVENKNELQTLIKLGVNFAQGFYLARPVPEMISNIPDIIKNQILDYNVY